MTEESLGTGEEAAAAEAAEKAEIATKAVAEGGEQTGTPEEIAAKVAEAKAAAEKSESEEKVGAPEAYEDFTFPEGMEVDKASLEIFIPLAKEFDLSQENAQKLIDFDTKREQARVEAQRVQWEKTNDEWREEAKADPEFGKANLQASLGNVKTFLDKFATVEFRQMLDDTGMGNRLEVLRMFATVGKAMSNDKITTGLANVGGDTSVAQRMFPGQKP